MDRTDELKPCLFCSRKARLGCDSHGRYIRCENGMCSFMPTTWYYDKEDEVIEAWNRVGEKDE